MVKFHIGGRCVSEYIKRDTWSRISICVRCFVWLCSLLFGEKKKQIALGWIWSFSSLVRGIYSVGTAGYADLVSCDRWKPCTSPKSSRYHKTLYLAFCNFFFRLSFKFIRMQLQVHQIAHFSNYLSSVQVILCFSSFLTFFLNILSVLTAPEFLL